MIVVVVQICWYLAAVVQIQLCKYFIEIGNTEREYGVWGEINVLRYVLIFLFVRNQTLFVDSRFLFSPHNNRFAMTEYGKRSPIGSKLSLPALSSTVCCFAHI